MKAILLVVLVALISLGCPSETPAVKVPPVCGFWRSGENMMVAIKPDSLAYLFLVPGGKQISESMAIKEISNTEILMLSADGKTEVSWKYYFYNSDNYNSCVFNGVLYRRAKE